jgi:L-gulonolactone oxidase
VLQSRHGVPLDSAFDEQLGVHFFLRSFPDKTYSCTPAFFHTPSTEAEIVTIIRAAAAAGQCVKVVGACHSSHDIAFTSGHMVSLRNFNRILSLGDDTVTVEAGCTIKTLIQHLDQHQRALLNLGAICEQALAGAISTGTHGTGTKLGSLGDQVVALRILLADGSIVDCDAQNQSDLFFAARCSLGCLGVLLILTFHTVPQFKLERIQKYMSIDALCAKLPELMAKHERLEWFYEVWNAHLCSFVILLSFNSFYVFTAVHV